MHWSEFVFPPTCPGCGTEVWHRGEWCEACFNELYDVRHVTDLDGLALREVYVIGHYDKGLKSILGDIKFHGKKERVKWATPFLYSFMVDPVHKLSFKPDYVVPIPVSAKKRVIRGYNQVDLLFKNWASWLGWYWLDCLEKNDSTQAMFSLGRVERKANMVNAFKAMEPLVKSGQLEGKSILLVDDIFTTGATLESAAEVLKETYKVKNIVGVTLAGGH